MQYNYHQRDKTKISQLVNLLISIKNVIMQCIEIGNEEYTESQTNQSGTLNLVIRFLYYSCNMLLLLAWLCVLFDTGTIVVINLHTQIIIVHVKVPSMMQNLVGQTCIFFAFQQKANFTHF